VTRYAVPFFERQMNGALSTVLLLSRHGCCYACSNAPVYAGPGYAKRDLFVAAQKAQT
jgi:hypothetical protein